MVITINNYETHYRKPHINLCHINFPEYRMSYIQGLTIAPSVKRPQVKVLMILLNINNQLRNKLLTI